MQMWIKQLRQNLRQTLNEELARKSKYVPDEEMWKPRPSPGGGFGGGTCKCCGGTGRSGGSGGSGGGWPGGGGGGGWPGGGGVFPYPKPRPRPRPEPYYPDDNDDPIYPIRPIPRPRPRPEPILPFDDDDSDPYYPLPRINPALIKPDYRWDKFVNNKSR